MKVDSTLKSNLVLGIDDFKVRVLRPEDVTDTYVSWFEDPEVISFIEFAQRKVTENELKSFVLEKLNSENAILLGIFKDQVHIGNIKFEPIDLVTKTAVMGILIGNRLYRSQGVGTLILKSCCEALRNILGLKYIELGVDKSNERAINSYKKSGFVIEEDSKYLSNQKGLIMRLTL